MVHRVESQVTDANPATTIQDADTDPVLHHSIGTPVDSDHEADIDDDTASLVTCPGGRPSVERIESMFSDATESVAGEGAVPQDEDPPPVEDITPGRALRGGFGESRRSGCVSSDAVQSSRDENSPKILARGIQICDPICFTGGQRGQHGT